MQVQSQLQLHRVLRTERAICLMQSECLTIKDKKIKAALQSGYDVVFNTVPSRIFSAPVLGDGGRAEGGEKTLYVDLASSPGGFDPAAARQAGIRLLWALSLPGKYAPDSAGRVLGEEMLALLSKGGETV